MTQKQTIPEYIEALLKAVKNAHDHTSELRDAWQTGALSTRDESGGTRPNRNVDVEVELRRVLALPVPQVDIEVGATATLQEYGLRIEDATLVEKRTARRIAQAIAREWGLTTTETKGE